MKGIEVEKRYLSFVIISNGSLKVRNKLFLINFSIVYIMCDMNLMCDVNLMYDMSLMCDINLFNILSKVCVFFVISFSIYFLLILVFFDEMNYY